MEPLEILFEDAQILAVNKPSGIPSHNLNETAAQSGVQTVESILQAARGIDQVFIVHRLDTGTSGVLLFAKNAKTYDAMREKFKLKQLRKYYRAWSDHEPEIALKLPTEITLPLAHHPKSKKRMIVLPIDKKISYRGNPIPAHSKVLAAQKTKWLGVDVTELQVEIITGVMHQIRVHLKHLGYPLVGDAIYNAVQNAEKENPEESLPTRLGLHAERIEFELEGFRYVIEAPLPKF